MSSIHIAVFPVAGLGTRFLPATKAIAKEMLTVVDKPLIQYASEEAVAAGIDTLVFVVGRTKNAIIDQHFIYRKRHNRLISLICEHPELLGMGIDEGTSVIVYPNNIIEVMGEHQVIIYDASDTQDIGFDERGFTHGSNIKMHILDHGKKFNLITKQIFK